MLIKAQTLTWNTFDIENVKPTDTIRAIKETVERNVRIPTDHQRFVADGKELTDCQTAEECGLTDGIIIHLVVRAPRHKCGESCYTISP